MRRVLTPGRLCGLSALALAALSPAAARADEDTAWLAARSRLYFYLDPEARALDPNAPTAIGMFSLAGAEGAMRAEASGWVGHGPGGVIEDPDGASIITGDVRTLLVRYATRRYWVNGGRMLTPLGTTDMESLDGVAGGVHLGGIDLAAVAARQGPDPREAFGDAWVFGGSIGGEFADAWRLSLAGRHRRYDDTNPETQFTARAGYYPSATFDVTARATAAVENTALAEARVDATKRLNDDLAFGGFVQRNDLRAMLPPDELLAVFAHDDRSEAGARADWVVLPSVATRAEVAAVYGEDRTLAGAGRLGADWRPGNGTIITADGEERLDPSEVRTTLRTALRTPFSAETSGTFELVGDRANNARETRWNGAGRVGVVYNPFDAWSLYTALESGVGDAFPNGRLGGMLFVEYAAGAPVRWGGLP
jgi:hypothetical protein